MNKVQMIGRLTREPEISYSKADNSKAIARWSMAVNRRYKTDDGPDADFFNCVAFGKTAEVVERYCPKGKQIGIVGHLQNNYYTNKDGVKMYPEVIVVDELELLGSKNDGNTAANNDSKPSATDEGGFMNIPEGIDEELPFN